MKHRMLAMIAALCLLFMGPATMASVTKGPPRISIDQLKNRLNDPDLVIFDVRAGFTAKTGEAKVQGAVRKDPEKTQDWAQGLDPDKTYVLYCA